MYWGKSLDQCTNQFCNTKWSFSLPFAQNNQETQQNKSLRIQNPKKSSIQVDTQKDKLNEKRSLKRSQNNLKSHTQSSLNNSTILFAQVKNSSDAPLSKKTSMRNFSQKQQIFLTKIPDTSTNANTLRCNTPKYRPLSHMNSVDFSNQAWFKQNKIKDGPIYTFSNQSCVQQNLPTKKISHIKTQCSENVSSNRYSSSFCHENSFRRHSNEKIENWNHSHCLSPNGRNYESFKMEKQSIKVLDLRDQSFQLPRPETHNKNHNFQLIQLNSPQNYLQLYQTRNAQDQSIRNLVSDQACRYLPNQFPTIRQQNSAYEQSKSINDCSNARSLNSAPFYEGEQKTLTQNISLLSAINNSLSHEQYKHQDTFYDVLRNKDVEFEAGLDSSKIQGNSKGIDFNLSCQELLLQEQKPQFQQHLQNFQIYEQFKNNFDPQIKQMYQRSFVHQPSICLKMIENKLRGTTYQMSQTSSQGIQSQLRCSIPIQSRQQMIPYIPTPHTITSQNQGFQPLMMTNPYRMKTPKNLVRFRFHKKSGFIENNKQNQLNQLEPSSPIKILEKYKENQIHNLATFSKPKEKDKAEINNDPPEGGLLKEMSLNLNDNSSEKDPQPSIRKMCVTTKKVKSLVQHKRTINSIFDDSSSFNKQCSNQLISRFMIEDGLDILDGTPSHQNVNRDESTVIDRYTFNSRMEKLP